MLSLLFLRYFVLVEIAVSGSYAFMASRRTIGSIVSHYRRYDVVNTIIVLAAESSVGGKDFSANAVAAAADDDDNEQVPMQEKRGQSIVDQWRSPNFLWSRRDTGMATTAAASVMIAGPWLMQQQQQQHQATTATTLAVSSSSSSDTAATAALEAGDALIRNIWLGRLAYPTLIVALEMGLFEALKDRSLSLEQLGRNLQPRLSGTSSRALEAITSVLMALGLVQWNNHNSNINNPSIAETGYDDPIRSSNLRLSLTEPARAVLLQDSPYFWGAQLLAADGVTATLRRRIQLESRLAATGGSTTTTKTTTTPIGVVSYESHSDQVIDSFIDSMQSHSGVTAVATAKALDSVLPHNHQLFGDGRSCHVLDMAGGSGCFALALAKRYPNIKVTLADLPNVVASWKRRHQGASASVVRRIDAVPANLFDATTWPRDCQVVLLANVLHDWGEMQVLDILTNARLALLTSRSNSRMDGGDGGGDDDGMVVIVEQLLNQERTGPLPAALASISMLLGDWRTGKQYTLAELSTLAEKAGFRHTELGPACGAFHHAVICRT